VTFRYDDYGNESVTVYPNNSAFKMKIQDFDWVALFNDFMGPTYVEMPGGSWWNNKEMEDSDGSIFYSDEKTEEILMNVDIEDMTV